MKNELIIVTNQNKLVEYLVSITSDNDTNGENGFDYLWDAAQTFFGFFPEQGKTYSDEKYQKFTNDNYLIKKYTQLQQEGVSVENLINRFFEERLFYESNSLASYNYKVTKDYIVISYFLHSID